MTTPRRLSRKVALTAAFLALAAGGTAACDAPHDEDADSYEWMTHDSDPGGYASGPDDSDSDDEYAGDEPTDEVFYCADEDGEIVDDDNCDDGSGTSSYFLWHSPGYPRGLRPGTLLDGGEAFPAGDRATRRAFKLPVTGIISNGTVKTNIVGRGSSGSGLTSGSSGG